MDAAPPLATAMDADPLPATAMNATQPLATVMEADPPPPPQDTLPRLTLTSPPTQKPVDDDNAEEAHSVRLAFGPLCHAVVLTGVLVVAEKLPA